MLGVVLLVEVSACVVVEVSTCVVVEIAPCVVLEVVVLTAVVLEVPRMVSDGPFIKVPPAVSLSKTTEPSAFLSNRGVRCAPIIYD